MSIKHAALATLATGLSLSLAVLGGCSKSDSGESSGKVAHAEPMTITALSLKADVPKGATQSEMAGSIMVQAPGYVFTVNEAKEIDPKTLEEEKKEAEMFSAKNHTSEKLADGYVLRFENKGSMGANYWLKVRREIDGKVYRCETMGPTKEIVDNAVKACKSLRR